MNFKYLNFFKKFDFFLLLNYPSIWASRLYYVSILSISISLFLFLYPFKLYQIPYTYPYLIYIVLILFAYWIFKQREFVASKEYPKVIIGARKEFILYIIVIFFFFLPLFSILIISDSLIENKFTFNSKTIYIDYIVFDKNELKYQCSYDKEDKEYKYNIEGKDFCPINDENKIMLNIIINSLSSSKNIKHLNKIDFTTIKNRYSFLESTNPMSYIENILLWIFIFMPFLIIYFNYYSNVGKKWFFIPIYFGGLIIILYFIFSQNESWVPTLDENIKGLVKGHIKTEETSKKIITIVGALIWWLFYNIPLIIMYIFLSSYRLIIYFQIIFSTILALIGVLVYNPFVQYEFFLFSPNASMYLICILIMLFFIKSIINHIIFLNSQPRDL